MVLRGILHIALLSFAVALTGCANSESAVTARAERAATITEATLEYSQAVKMAARTCANYHLTSVSTQTPEGGKFEAVNATFLRDPNHATWKISTGKEVPLRIEEHTWVSAFIPAENTDVCKIVASLGLSTGKSGLLSGQEVFDLAMSEIAANGFSIGPSHATHRNIRLAAKGEETRIKFSNSRHEWPSSAIIELTRVN